MTLFDVLTQDQFISIVWEMLDAMYPAVSAWLHGANHYELKRDFNAWARRVYAMHLAYDRGATDKGHKTYDYSEKLWTQWVTDLDNAMYEDGLDDSLSSPVTNISLWRFSDIASDVLLKARWHRFDYELL